MLNQKSVTSLNLKDDTITRMQTNILDALNPLLQTPILDGVLVQGLTIPASGKLVVSHGLGRRALGVLIV